MKKRVYNIDGKVLVEGAELSELLNHEILVKKNDDGKIEDQLVLTFMRYPYLEKISAYHSNAPFYYMFLSSIVTYGEFSMNIGYIQTPVSFDKNIILGYYPTKNLLLIYHFT